MNFQCRNRSAGRVFDNRCTILQSVTGGDSTPLPLAVTPNDSLRGRCHNLLHILDWTCEWEWNNVERFAHLHWLEQKLKNVPVVTNAPFSLLCVLLTHNHYGKDEKESSYTSSAW